MDPWIVRVAVTLTDREEGFNTVYYGDVLVAKTLLDGYPDPLNDHRQDRFEREFMKIARAAYQQMQDTKSAKVNDGVLSTEGIPESGQEGSTVVP